MTTTAGLVVTNYVGVTMGAPAAVRIARKASRHGVVVFGSESDDLPGDAFELPHLVRDHVEDWQLAHSEADPGRDGSSLAVRDDRVRIAGRVTRHPLITQRMANRAHMNVRYALVADLVIDGWYELRVASVHLPLGGTGLQDVAAHALREIEGVDLFAGDLNMTRRHAASVFPRRTVRGLERLHVAARAGIRVGPARRLNLAPSDHPGVRVGLVIPARPGGRP